MTLETLDSVASSRSPAPAMVASTALVAEALAPPVHAEEDAPFTAEETDQLLVELTDPLNRYYRYPVARALLPVFMRLPFTPNHITVMHACMGIASGVLIARGGTRDMLFAFLLAEGRMIFDCLDGVVARAKKLTSPNGRTIDEMGDTVGYMAMQVGALVNIHRNAPDENLPFMLAAGLLVPGWMAMTYDYYKRTFHSLLRGTHDGPAEVLVRRTAAFAREGGGAVARFALAFEWLQAILLTPLAIPQLRARVRRERDEAGVGQRDPADDACARGARRRARTPAFRRMLRFASIVTGDNAITFFNFGLLTASLVLVEKLMIAVGFSVFVVVTTVCAMWVSSARRLGEARE